MKRKTTALICGGILLVAAGVTAAIFFTEPTASRSEASKQTAMLVQVEEAEWGDFQPTIIAVGSARPSKEIRLSPRVRGEIAELSASFVPGGFVEEGELLLRIDPADYQLELKRRESELRQAKADLALEMGRQNVAEQDYALLDAELDEELDAAQEDLVLRKPQLNSALATVESAQAAVDQAKTDLARTEIRAPFDAHIITRNANRGSQVAPGEDLGRLVGRDVYWVEATVPVSKLRWIDVPASGQERDGAAVQVRDRAAWPEGRYRSGYVQTLVGSLEGNTRMARLLVAVPDPLAYESGDESPALMIGAFVETRIEGKRIEGVARVKRDHVRDEDQVWVMEDGALSIRDLEVVFRDAEYAYAKSGLEAGDQIVTTNLSAPTEGAELRTEEEEEEAGEESGAAARSDSAEGDSE